VRAARAKSLPAGEKTMVGWDGIEPPPPGFQDPPPISRLGRMICSHQLQSVALRRGNVTCGSGSGRVETHGSVRVEFESTRAVGTARIREKGVRPTGQHGFKSPRGTGRGWPRPWLSRSMWKRSWQPRRLSRPVVLVWRGTALHLVHVSLSRGGQRSHCQRSRSIVLHEQDGMNFLRNRLHG